MPDAQALAPAIEAPITRRLPPLWLSASGLTAAITVAFGIHRWIDHFLADPYAEDFRVWIVAARVGFTNGWSHLYELDLQRAASSSFGPVGSLIDSMHLYLGPPPAAWAILPLAWLPVPIAYLVWTLINLCAFAGAGWLVCRGTSLVRVTLILAGLALWPVHYQFWLGQWVVATLAMLAVTWWALERDRWILAGVVLALAFMAKAQDAMLVPAALLVSGRWRPVFAFAVTLAVLVAASVAAVGPAGIANWYSDLQLVRADAHSASMTYSYVFGRVPLTTAIEISLGLAALALAWFRRDRLDLVFALGIVGTTASATYLHEDDIAILVLAAWIVLRAQPSLAQRLWLVAGIAAAQFISIGLPIPMLLWQPVWILLLGLEPRLGTKPAPSQVMTA